MFNEIVLNKEAQEDYYLRLKNKVLSTSCERSIDNILSRIFDDFKKIIELKGEI